MEKSQENPISYRPSLEIKKLFNQYCGERALLSKTQLIEIAFKIAMMRPKEELDALIWRFLTGKSDDTELEGNKEKLLKKTGTGKGG